MTHRSASRALAPAAAVHAPLIPDLDASPALWSAPLAESAVNQFETALGGRSELVGELLSSPDLTPRLQQILRLTLDPRFDRYSLATLCEKAGILPGEVFAAFRDALTAKAGILAMRLVVEKIPAITSDLLKDAVDHDGPCETCAGTGTVTYAKRGKPPEQVPCIPCHGRGLQLIRADREVQKITLELIGLLGKNAGVNIAIDNRKLTQNTLNLPESAGLVQLQQAVSGILFGQTPVLRAEAPVVAVDAEVV